MPEVVLGVVEDALEARRAVIRQLVEQAPADKLDRLLAQLGEEKLTNQLAVIDDSLARARSGRLGVCEVCHEGVNARRLLVDYTAHVCLDHLSSDQASSLEREIELAQRTQQSLLPAEIPSVPGLAIAAFSRPAEFVSGDYFDFIPLAGGTPGLIVCDVAGHGVSASLHMARLQALARAVLPEADSPSAAVATLHRLFLHNSHFPTFATGFLGAYTPASRTLSYCNAGHNPPLVLRAGPGGPESAVWLRPTSAAIGLVEGGVFLGEEVSLDPGDILVVYTDGVVEAESPAGLPFGADGLLTAVRRQGGASPHDLLEDLTGALENHVGQAGLRDDVTLVVARAV